MVAPQRAPALPSSKIIASHAPQFTRARMNSTINDECIPMHDICHSRFPNKQERKAPNVIHRNSPFNKLQPQETFRSLKE
jgi:hypothetical protein